MAEKGRPAVVFWGPDSVGTERYAHHLNATCYLIHYLSWKRPWIAPIKYPPMWIKTWWVLLKQRPSSVLVINTPVFAPICVYFYCLFARIPFAMKVHGHTLEGRKWGWSRPLQQFLAKKAVVNLIDTAEYKQIFESWGARVLFLENPPLIVPPVDSGFVACHGKFRVTVVSTFAGDEPLDLVVEAARSLQDVCFFILGDTKLAKKELMDSAPQNVVFTGYLVGNDYWAQLHSSQAILTLTTNPHSLVSGGTEGLHIHKPLILSRQPALLDYFTKGTVFIDHEIGSIVDGVQQVLEHQSVLSKESAELSAEKSAEWKSVFQEFINIMGEAHA
jgi:hypothetical protein